MKNTGCDLTDSESDKHLRKDRDGDVTVDNTRFADGGLRCLADAPKSMKNIIDIEGKSLFSKIINTIQKRIFFII